MPTALGSVTADAAPHSSRGLGHRPLKAEITGSNPVCGTTSSHLNELGRRIILA